MPCLARNLDLMIRWSCFVAGTLVMTVIPCWLMRFPLIYPAVAPPYHVMLNHEEAHRWSTCSLGFSRHTYRQEMSASTRVPVLFFRQRHRPQGKSCSNPSEMDPMDATSMTGRMHERNGHLPCHLQAGASSLSADTADPA